MLSPIRIAGWIALPLVATTLQAHARALPEVSATHKFGKQTEKRQLILVITPNTNVWQDTGIGPSPDDPQPNSPGELWNQLGQPDWRLDRADIVRGADSRQICPSSAKAYLTSRYPHAPPA